MDVWITRPDQSVVLAKQAVTLSFAATATSGFPVIAADEATSYQSVDGFDIHYRRQRFIISIKWTRVPGPRCSTNSSAAAATYWHQLPAGKYGRFRSQRFGVQLRRHARRQTDPTLANFSLSLDTVDVIPVLKEILAINPNIKILVLPGAHPCG